VKVDFHEIKSTLTLRFPRRDAFALDLLRLSIIWRACGPHRGEVALQEIAVFLSGRGLHVGASPRRELLLLLLLLLRVWRGFRLFDGPAALRAGRRSVTSGRSS
jgi:hypothetical protein